MQHSILHSPVILYLVGLVAIGNLMIFVYAQQFLSIGVFILSVLLMSYFTKNLVAALVVAIVICNIVCGISGQTEGFKGKKAKNPLAKIKKVLKKVSNSAVLNNSKTNPFYTAPGTPAP